VNVVDQIFFAAGFEPTALAVCAPGTHYNAVSYGRLTTMADAIGARGLAAGLRAGNTVAIAARDPIFHLSLILGMARIGVVTMSVHGAAWPSEVAVDAVLADRPLPATTARIIEVDRGWAETGASIRTGPSAIGDDDRLTRIVLTSGTTGAQKAVALRNIDVIRRLQSYTVFFGRQAAASTRLFVDVGLTTSYGYTWTLHVLARGGAVFFRGADPAETLQAFGLYNVEAMVASPAGIAEFLDYYERSPAFVCPFRVMVSGGGLMARALSERVRARMCPQLMVSYGSTEVSPVATAAAFRVADIPGAVGYVVPWLTVEAVDAAYRPLPAGTEGRIRIRGDTCVSGYVGNPAASGVIFRDGWFYPGDVGSITDERLLIVSGRQDAVLNLGGEKINPEAIEAVLLSCPGIIHAAVFAFPNARGVDEVRALVTTIGDIEPQSVRAHCARSLAADFVPARVVRVTEIPRNDMGRIDRDRARKLIQAD
jgi:acyl-CoA synthetase (AMP-forming)/AMP-acid ligase II